MAVSAPVLNARAWWLVVLVVVPLGLCVGLPLGLTARSTAWEQDQARQYLAALHRADRRAAGQVCNGLPAQRKTLDAQLLRWGGAAIREVQFAPLKRTQPSLGPTTMQDVTFTYQLPGQTRWLRSRLRIFWQYRDPRSLLDVAILYPWLPPAARCSAVYVP